MEFRSYKRGTCSRCHCYAFEIIMYLRSVWALCSALFIIRHLYFSGIYSSKVCSDEWASTSHCYDEWAPTSHWTIWAKFRHHSSFNSRHTQEGLCDYLKRENSHLDNLHVLQYLTGQDNFHSEPMAEIVCVVGSAVHKTAHTLVVPALGYSDLPYLQFSIS